MADIFVSYAHEDRERVRPIVAALEAEGFSVWWDQHLAAGATFDAAIETALDTAKAVIVIWSQVSRTKDWVRAEALDARDERKLVPVMVDAVRLRPPFNILHTENFIGWSGDRSAQAWQRLLLQVRALVGESALETGRGIGRRADGGLDVSSDAPLIARPQDARGLTHRSAPSRLLDSAGCGAAFMPPRLERKAA